MSPEKKARLFALAAALVSFGTAIGLVIYIARNQAAVTSLIRDLGPAGPVASVLLYGVLAVSPVPADPLTLINGAVFGPLWGGLIAWIGMTFAALVEYFVGAQISRVAEFEQKRKDLPFGLGKLPVDSILFLLGGRMLTGAGSKAVSYLSGMYHVSLWRYTWTASISNLFGSFLFAMGGAGLLNLL